MTTQEEPRRFAVVVRAMPDNGPTCELHVTTWFGSGKAIVLAAEEFKRRYPTSSIYDVAVTDLGATAVDEHNVVVVPPGDLRDRNEW